MPRWFNNNPSNFWEGRIKEEYLERVADSEVAAPPGGYSQLQYDNLALHQIGDVISFLYFFRALLYVYAYAKGWDGEGKRINTKYTLYVLLYILRWTVSPDFAFLTTAFVGWRSLVWIYKTFGLKDYVDEWSIKNLNKRKELEAELRLLNQH